MVYIHILLVQILLTFHQASARRQDRSETCDLQLWQHRPQQWHDFTEGFTYGMYRNPPVTVNKCYMCDWAAKGVSDMQSIFLDLEFIRGMWTEMGFFNSIGGWDFIPPLTASSPIVQSSQSDFVFHPTESKYIFITWQATVDWSKRVADVGDYAQLALYEYGRRTHEGLSDFAEDIIDGFGEFGNGFQYHMDAAQKSLYDQARKFSDQSKKHYDAYQRCVGDVNQCTEDSLARIRQFFNDPHVKIIYEYHMNKMQDMADDVGLGEYFQKVRFLSDIGFMFWGLGYTIDKLVTNDLLHNLLENGIKRFDSFSQVQVEMNVFKDWDVVMILLMTMPGKSCESIGTRLGIVTRKIYGISMEGLVDAFGIEGEFFDKMNDEYWEQDEDEEEFDFDICAMYCKRIPWYPDYVVEDTCPRRCMDANPNWRKDYSDDWYSPLDPDLIDDGEINIFDQ